MKEQFVPYELALKLKELGFDEECLRYYNTNLGKKLFINSGDIKAPLWQQAFDWVREKHKIIYNITFKDDNYKFSYGNMNSATNLYMSQYPTYEEARLACLEKLIELVSAV